MYRRIIWLLVLPNLHSFFGNELKIFRPQQVFEVLIKKRIICYFKYTDDILITFKEHLTNFQIVLKS